MKAVLLKPFPKGREIQFEFYNIKDLRKKIFGSMLQKIIEEMINLSLSFGKDGIGRFYTCTTNTGIFNS
jgi:hypothetical protein